MTIKLLPVTKEYSYAGVVTARHEIPMAFQVTGKLAKRLVDVGDKVKANQLLAVLDAHDLKIQLEIKEEMLSSSKSNLDFTKSEFDRYSSLIKKGYVTASQIFQLRSKYESALADSNRARNDIASAQRQLGYTNLYSQVDGVVIDTMKNAGEVVEAGTPILKLATSSEKEITISVPEHRVLQWRQKGVVFIVTLWSNPAKKYAVHVREISSDAEPVTRTFTIRLSVPKADAEMMLGMTANVKLQVLGPANIVIPITSIFYKENQPNVWVIDPKELTVKAVAVTLGQYNQNNMVSVDKGLEDGQMIVIAGAHQLLPGQKVSVLDPNK